MSVQTNKPCQHCISTYSFRNEFLKHKNNQVYCCLLNIKKNKKTCCSQDAANLLHVFTICNSEVMVNTAVLLIVSTHPADSNVSEIKFQFKVKFTHYAEIMQSQGKQCVICNSAYKTRLGILKERTKLKKRSLLKPFFHLHFFFTNLYRKSYKTKTTCLKHLFLVQKLN